VVELLVPGFTVSVVELTPLLVGITTGVPDLDALGMVGFAAAGVPDLDALGMVGFAAAGVPG